jgi:hypothetical protein
MKTIKDMRIYAGQLGDITIPDGAPLLELVENIRLGALVV